PLPPELKHQINDREQREPAADPDHGLEGVTDDVHRRTVGGRDRVESLDLGVEPMEGEQGEQVRQRNPVLDLPTRVPTEDVDGGARGGLAKPLEGGELGRLRARDLAAGPVADEGLCDRRERRYRKWDCEGRALVPAPAAA